MFNEYYTFIRNKKLEVLKNINKDSIVKEIDMINKALEIDFTR
jgi:hypothetical protein